ncbi:hypothetical protein X771_26725 [Mesorhizobium sp. LSJC277A00]|nr:hypothetical protein X771_26725 [Mesorhizobium sp. LSJC277A00]ESY10591.1 hypothetical protein X752_18440 [Mesorhizobium sp. LNJC398B00]ESY24393.1 hypothetical protein X750_12575 [Mesorhizobium sp. LNJC394B00]
MVEQLTLNQRVHSSILCAPTKFLEELVEDLGMPDALTRLDMLGQVCLKLGGR